MSSGSYGIAEFIGVRPGGRRVRSGSLRGARWGLSGSIGVARFIRVSLVSFGVIGVRPEVRRVRSGSMGSLGCALADIGIGSLGGRPVRSRSLGSFVCALGDVRFVWDG